MIISIIIPCYNEKSTIEKIIHKIIEQRKLNKQIILIDDHSNDGTTEIIKEKLSNNLIDKIIFHEKNLGKGAAIKSGIPYVNGDIIIIQDADLEYDPNEYKKLLSPFEQSEITVVYGSRVLGKSRFSKNNGITKNFRILANWFLTALSNLLNNQNLTDAHTCYKVFRKKIFEQISLEEKGFSFCPEITTKLGRKGIKIYEVPISYQGRDYKDGKKINLFDGFKAIFTLIKYRYFK